MIWLILAINLLFPTAEDPEAAAAYALHEWGGTAVQQARDIVCREQPSVEACGGQP